MKLLFQWKWEYRYIFKILISILLDIYPKVGMLIHMIVSFLIFWENSTLLSIELSPFYITNNTAKGSDPNILPKTCYLSVFWKYSSYRVWDDSLWWFWFAFIWKVVVLRTYSNASAYLCVFFGEMSIQVLCQLLICVIQLLLWVKEVPYIFWISVPHILERGMAVHSRILVWRIPVAGEPAWL